MTINIYKIHKCRLCDSTLLDVVLSLKPTPLADDYLPREKASRSIQCFPVDVVLCRACGNAQLTHVISSHSIYGDYTYETNRSPGLIKHFEQGCEHIIKKILLSPLSSYVVDLGCNDGTLLEAFDKRDIKVIGVEPSPAADIAGEKGFLIYKSYFNENIARQILSTHGVASLVTANNMFANIDNLNEFVYSLKIIMSFESVFVIETSYWKSLIEHGIFDFIYHEHLSYFSIYALQKFFIKHDMKIFDVEHIETKGGSIRIFVQLKNGNQSEKLSVIEFIESEKKLGLFDHEIYRQFLHKIENAKIALQDFLNCFRIEKKFLVGYGASASVTALLYSFDLGDRINFLVDDNSIKHNTLSPGYHIPVHDAPAIYENNIKYVLILPWRFSKQIILRNLKFINESRFFIDIYPKPAIIDYGHVSKNLLTL